MTVIVSKSDYIDKANTLLKDTKIYQPLDTDPSKTTVNRTNMKLKQLKDKDRLEETNYKRIRPNDASTAKFTDYRKYIKKIFLYDLLSPSQDHLHTSYQNILL